MYDLLVGINISSAPVSEMGQEQSIIPVKSQNKMEMLSISWMQFVKRICELNDRCAKFVDSDGRYLLFAIKKGSADTFLWKVTIRICILKKSLHHLLKDVTGEIGEEVPHERSLNAHIFRTLGAGTCIICMERRPDVILPCVHTFCSVCIEQWKSMGKDWCPLCRQSLRLDGSDTWVIPDVSESCGLKNYLMSLTESDCTDSWGCL